MGLADAGVLVCAPPSRSQRGQGDALDGAAGSVTNSALSLGGAASRCAALRAASCELLRRAARGWWPRVAREGWVTPRRLNALDAFPWGPGHGTLRWTRTGEQAGKALRSQGHHYARVM